MKAKTRLKLIVLLAVSMAAAVIGGCSIGLPTYEETIENNNLTALVTYYGNGGYFDSSTAIVYRLIGSQEGTAFYNIQSSGTSTTVTRGTGWLFDGWYYIQTVQIEGEDGEEEEYFVCTDDTVAANYTITEDDETRVVVTTYNSQKVISHDDYDYMLRYATSASAVPLLQLGDAVDTTMKLAEGHIYLAAKWTVDQGVDYVLVMKDGTKVTYSLTTTDSEGNSNQEDFEAVPNDILYTNYFGRNTSLTILQSSPLSSANSSYVMTDGTWLEFYEDAACTKPYSSTQTFTKPESGNLTVYALFTTGLWEVVKDSSDVKAMFSSTSKDYYLFNDVDCSTLDAVTAMSTFAGSIEGNGYTISNLTVQKTDIYLSDSNNAVFGMLVGDASIKNVTFDNMTVNFSTRAPSVAGVTYSPYVYFLVASLLSGATPSISNAYITNSTMNLTVESGVTVMNIQNASDTDNWLYGITRGSTANDSEFADAYGSFTISDTCLVLKQSQGNDADGKKYYLVTSIDYETNSVTERYYLWSSYYTDADEIVYSKRTDLNDEGEEVSTYYTYTNASGEECTTYDDPSA